MSHQKRKSVLVFASYPPSLVNFRLDLLTSLVSSGYKVYALAPFISSDPTISTHLEAIGVRPINTRDLRHRSIFSLPFYLVHVLRLFYSLQPDLLLPYTLQPVLISGLLIPALRIWNPYVKFFPIITGVGFIYTEGSRRILRLFLRLLFTPLYKLALSSSSVVIFQNPDDRHLYLSRKLISPDQETLLIPGSGVNPANFHRLPLAPKPIFLMLSRLLVDKGVLDYIAAAYIVKRQYPDAMFLLAGMRDTNLSSITDSDYHKLLTSDVVQYLGHLQDVSHALRQCRFYVLPSYREGTPRSSLEALASGRPIITTDVPGCRETVVQGYNGLLVPPRNPTALAQAMIDMLSLESDDINRMASNSILLASNKFHSDIVCRLILACLSSS